MRNLLVSLEDTESLPLVREHLLPKRDRSFIRTDAEIKRLIQLTTKNEIVTPAGLYLGDTPAFDLDTPIVQRFIERMSRGLLWEAFTIPFFEGTFPFHMNVDLYNMGYSGFQKFGVIRKIHDAFTFGALQGKGEHPDWVVFNFYGNLEFLVRVNRK